MATFTHFSRHAFHRVYQRTELTCEQLARILDERLYVLSGETPGFNREHLVFFSQPDEEFFVAIRDRLTGTVVTVLPLAYHENLAWPIPESHLRRAKSLIESATPRQPPQISTQPPSTFIVSASYTDNAGHHKTKIITREPAVNFRFDTKTFVETSDIFERLPTLAHAKNIDPATVSALLVRLGKHGQPQVIDIDELSSNFSSSGRESA